jgi:hypothetical protein
MVTDSTTHNVRGLNGRNKFKKSDKKTLLSRCGSSPGLQIQNLQYLENVSFSVTKGCECGI